MQLLRIKDHNGAHKIQQALAEDEDTDNVEEDEDTDNVEGTVQCARDDDAGVCTAANSREKEQNETGVVFVANTMIDPWAVMI